MNSDLFDSVSTIDTGARSDFDFYETPSWMTRSLLHFHPAIKWTRVLEPCSGRNAIANVLRADGKCIVRTNDIDERQPADWHQDATDPSFWKHVGGEFDYIVSNTAFNVAFAVMVHALPAARKGMALLLRKSILEPTEQRGEWLSKHPPTRIIGLPRHSFRGTGSDSQSCDWLIWEHEPDRTLPPIVIDHLAKSRRGESVTA